MKKVIYVVVFLGVAAGAVFYSGMYKSFLGSDDYAMQETGTTSDPAAVSVAAPKQVEKKQQREYWEKPGFNAWTKYKKLMIDEVKVEGTSSVMSVREQKMLGAYYRNAMRNAVQARYRVVNQPGPDVLRVRAVIKSVSSTGPTGEDGSVTMHGKLLDSESGESLVKMEDTKSGSLFSSGAIWGDITKGFDNWAAQLYGLLSNKLGNVVYEEETQPVDNVIFDLLSSAEDNLFANRLTSPQGNNALDNYRQVLKTDPNNGDAQKGIEKIVKKYAAWGQRGFAEGNSKRAWFYLDKARDILDEHPSVKRLENLLMGRPDTAVATPVISAPDVPAMTTETVADSVTETAPIADASTSEATASEQVAAATTEANAVVEAVAAAEADPWNNQPGKGSASFSSGDLNPFMLGIDTTGDVASISSAAKKRLIAAGFEVAGEYSPYDGVHIIAVTSDELKSAAGKNEFGGYGAVVRVAITEQGERVQVSYNNPVYNQNVYRLKGDLSAVASKLGSALGHEKAFGSKGGLSSSGLQKWHYMFGMPYFDDPDKLGSTSASTVDANLSAGKGGVKKVYRIDIPGSDEVLFGVEITNGAGADKTVMQTIDKEENRHSPHLPYEILVSGGKAYALNGKFRIALSFPDLTMGQFASISNAPGAITEALKLAAQ